MALGILSIFMMSLFVLSFIFLFGLCGTTKRQKLQQIIDLCIFFIKFIYRFDFCWIASV